MGAATASEDEQLQISAYAMSRKHTVIILMEDINSTTSFELEIIRRVEGIANDEYQTSEQRQCQLSDKYSSPLDVLRKINYDGL